MLSTESLYIIYLSTGFTVGFGHCVGMCGPIVVSLSLNLSEKGVILPNLLYNSGRILTYMLMGSVMGASGAFTMVTAHIASLQKTVMIGAGVLIVVMGLAMSGWIPLGRIFGDHYSPGGFISKGFSRLARVKSTTVFLPLGLWLGLLPCGPVYTALIGAVRAGMEAKTAIEGAVIGMGLMLAFGVGTVPALILVAKLADLGWLKRREIVYAGKSVWQFISELLRRETS